ncbi:putative membrane protein [Rhodotorula toruloides]|nr:putative membrane protein [Rhodotorula toruloides]
MSHTTYATFPRSSAPSSGSSTPLRQAHASSSVPIPRRFSTLHLHLAQSLTSDALRSPLSGRGQREDEEDDALDGGWRALSASLGQEGRLGEQERRPLAHKLSVTGSQLAEEPETLDTTKSTGPFEPETRAYVDAAASDEGNGETKRRIPLLSPLAKNVAKCVLSYFLAELFTFVPFLSDALGSPFDVDGPIKNAHVVATVAVYFMPSRTIGGMVEADLFLSLAALFAIFLSCGSMAMTVFLDAYDLLTLGHALVLVLWIGCGYGCLAYAKVVWAKPTVSTACSLVSLVCSPIITKEGAFLGEFQTEAIKRILLIALVGSVISNLVCFLVWPQSATTQFQTDLDRTLDSFSTLLEMLARTFLLDPDSSTTSTELKRAIDTHKSTFTTLRTSLSQAKYEVFDRRISGRTTIYDSVVAKMQHLAQGLTGMRAGCSLQFDVLRAREGGVGTADGEDGLLDEVTVLERFKERVEPSLRQVVASSKRVLHALKASAPATTTADDLEAPTSASEDLFRLQQQLEHDLTLFRREHSKAVKILYRSLPEKTLFGGDLELSLAQRETRGAPNENLFRIYHFCFNLEEWAGELLALVSIFIRLRATDEAMRRELHQARAKWGRIANVASLLAHISTDRQLDSTLTQRAEQLGRQLSRALQTPRRKHRSVDAAELSLLGRVKLSMWHLAYHLRQPNLRFAIKTGAGAAILSAPAFVPSLRPLWLTWRGEWSLISYMVIAAPSLGQTNFLAFGRIAGTAFGAAVALAFWTAFPENAIVLPILGALFSAPCFYIAVSRPHLAATSRFVLLTFNLTCLYAFNLREIDVPIGSIAFHRSAAVIFGVAWGLIVNSYVWPFEARRELRKGLSEFFVNISHFYERIVRTYSSAGVLADDAVSLGGETSPLLRSEAEDLFSTMELELQLTLIRVSGLLSATRHEPRIKGPFPVAPYRDVLAACQSMLDSLTAIVRMTRRDAWLKVVRRDFVLPVNEQRREMVGNVILYLALLSSAVSAKTPLPPFLPPAEQARERLVAKLRDLEVVKRRLVRGGSESLLYYAYTTSMQDVIAPLDLLGAIFQRLFGIIASSQHHEDDSDTGSFTPQERVTDAEGASGFNISSWSVPVRRGCLLLQLARRLAGSCCVAGLLEPSPKLHSCLLEGGQPLRLVPSSPRRRSTSDIIAGRELRLTARTGRSDLEEDLGQMATLDERTYSSTFSGLKSTAITSGAVIAGGLLIKEILQRLRRYPDEDARRKQGQPVPDRGVEAWAMGYLYRARTYVAGLKTPNYSRWPLAWVIEAYKRDEHFYESHAGLDAATYIRFLRGTLFFTTFLLLTAFPVLMGINFVYAASRFDTDSIDRASITALVDNQQGLFLLPVHTTFVWLTTLAWFATLVWFGRGLLRMRRRELRKLLADSAERRQRLSDTGAVQQPLDVAFSPELDPSIADGELGWRYRTVLVRNIPPRLRSEEAIRSYFEHHLRESSPSSSTDQYPPASRDDKKFSQQNDTPLISEIVLLRRQTELNELYFTKYQEVLHQLETAHVELARNVMGWVREEVRQQERTKQGLAPPMTPWRWIKGHIGRRRAEGDVERDARAGDAELLAALRPFLDSAADLQSRTLWDALATLRSDHPSILDRFQPLIRLRRFRSASVPTVDYFLAKHNLFYSLIEDQRSQKETVEAASTAFVTFARADDARRARKELRYRPVGKIYGRMTLEWKVKMAPEFRDLHWHRLVVVSLSSDLLRNSLLNALVWAVTIIWVLPISVLIGLLSLESLQQHVPSLANFLNKHSVARSLVTSLLPTALISLLNMYTPTVIGILQRQGKTLITESKWSLVTQAAYWKFLVGKSAVPQYLDRLLTLSPSVNLLIIFVIGITAFSAFLNAFRQPVSVLTVLAGAFPKASTFYTSYILLQTGVHTGIELSLLGISWINHASIRKYVAPRKRTTEGVPRFFGQQSWLANHLFVTSLTLVFAVLNPLIVPFSFIYFSFAVLTMKQQFAHVYYRRNFELGGRMIFRRVFRYSLDIAVLSQLVAVAFFWVLKRFAYGGACIPLIPITIAFKILGTRYFDHLLDELDEAKIDIICGNGEDPQAQLSAPLPTEEEERRASSVGGTLRSLAFLATVTIPSLALHPSAKLSSQKAVQFDRRHRKWQSERAAPSDQPEKSHTRANTAPDDWRRPMLEPVASSDEDSEVSHTQAAQVQADKTDAGALPHSAALPESSATVQTGATPPAKPDASSVVTAHPPIIRDDRPVSHLRYRNPAEVVPLSRSLWLPRDPLKPVDLGDTVDYRGRALVSSEGGKGVIGHWDEMEETAELEPRPEEGDPEKVQRRSSALGDDSAYTLQGTERIRVAADVAARLSPKTSPSLVRPSSPPSPQSIRHSPVLLRHPGAPKPSPPPIPSFEPSTASPDRLEPGYPFPESAAEPSATSPRRSTLSVPPPSPSRLSRIVSASTTTAQPPTSPAGPGTSPTRARTNRSASLVPSIRSFSRFHAPAGAAIAEATEPSVSQAEALRSELLEEERRSHLVHAKREEHRKAQERKDREADANATAKDGWFRKLLVRRDEGAVDDDT